jgi:hypothetical protein
MIKTIDAKGLCQTFLLLRLRLLFLFEIVKIITQLNIHAHTHVCVHLTNVLSFTDDVIHCLSRGPRAIAKWHIVCRRL